MPVVKMGWAQYHLIRYLLDAEEGEKMFDVDSTQLLYFFSTLAQCAVAFAALIGVFAIFRLQTNSSIVIQKHREAAEWLRSKKDARSLLQIQIEAVDSECHEGVKKELRRISDKVDIYSLDLMGEANRHMSEIDDAERFPDALSNLISYPLKLWASLFLVSIAAIPFTKPIKGGFDLIVCIVVIFLTGYLLLETKKVIQKCLNLKS
ncbi:MAG: hypothetical protein V1882_12605 [Candidatus Omnitrophota bacterium]